MELNLAAATRKMHIFTALRHRDFRAFWLGYVSSVTGHQIILVVQGWLIYELTGSAVLLGTVSLMAAVPAVSLTLFGGVVADRINPRRLLITVLLIDATALSLLATLIATDIIRVWHIFAFAFVWGTTGAFREPASQSLFPHLIDRADMTSAVGLNGTVHPGTRIIGPAVGGLIISEVAEVTGIPLLGAAVALYVAATGYALFAFFVNLIRIPPIKRAEGRNALIEIVEGIKLVLHTKIFLFLIGTIYFITFFGLSYSVLLPVFAKDVLNGDASLLGYLFGIGGAGSLVGALIGGSLGSSRRKGWMLFFSTLLFGASLAAFGLSHWTVISLGIVAFVGLAYGIYHVGAMSTVQLMIPDEFRGRVLAIWQMTHGVFHPLGMMAMGALASASNAYLGDDLGRFAGAPFAVIVGGLLVVAFAIASAARNREVRNLGA